MNVDFYQSTRKKNKYMAVFSDGTTTHFGGINKDGTPYSDFTIHKDQERKERYIKRHEKNENWDDFKTAGSLAYHILWNKPTLEESIKDYKRKFKLN